MPLSRLDNFLKNVKGNILYVDPNSLDATDSVENQGNSFARPFLTLQRALIESSRFSYQKGLDNDRFEKTTIYLAPGVYHIDNRPGFIPTGTNEYLQRSGVTSGTLPALNNTSNFDVFDPDNVLYKLNSIHGGVIIPRGTSIVGQDLRKVQIRPLYVPDPSNNNIERSAIFRVTGAVYMNSFTIKDANPQKPCYRDYTSNTFTPSYSHHKLTSFEYADGKNAVDIDDTFIDYSTDRTDLDMYYEKIGIVYGAASGREIEPDFPSSGVDIQPRIDEFRIVGPVSGDVGITSIKAGDGSTTSTIIDVELSEAIFGLNIDTNVIINNVPDSRYNGTYLVTEVTSTTAEGVTGFKYQVPNAPTDPLPSASGSSVELSTDTVTSASPYIFNVSLRSVYGLCGMHADGSKADGFKSMVVAQFTGVGLQIDDNAFVKYNTTSGVFEDSSTVPNLHTDIDAVYKPDYSNYHIKASNNSLIQLVSIFAIGYSNHFLVESGGDFSVTNSNSNFGQIALTSRGYKETAFSQDDVGYISQIIPPKSLRPEFYTIEVPAIDVQQTQAEADNTKLYFYKFNNEGEAPNSNIRGFRFGANEDEKINVVLTESGTPTVFSAKVVMDGSNDTSGKKESRVGRNVSTGNSISNNTFTFTEDHQFLEGESVRVISSDGRLPDGLDSNTIYFAIIGNNIGTNQLRIAKTFNDAIDKQNITFNKKGGTLTVESRVSDKKSGDVGHPIQFDDSNNRNQWFVNVSSTDNGLYNKIITLSTEATPRTFITRKNDSRLSTDRMYRIRYVIPADTGTESARPPQRGFILQESSDVSGANDSEVALEFANNTTESMSNDAQLRNTSFIANANYESGVAYYTTEKPHRLTVGSKVTINNVTSSLFPTVGTGNSGYNGTYEVSGISSAKTFSVNEITSSPGTFTNNTSLRTTALPSFSRKNFGKDFYVYDVETITDYENGKQDGVYYISVLTSDVIPSASPFNTNQYGFSQPLSNLYPQLDRDNPVQSPKSSVCHALSKTIGQVVIDDPKNSITGEAIDEFYKESGIGVGITDIVSDPVGTAYTIFTSYDHGLNKATRLTITNGGSNYGDGSSGFQNYYNAILIPSGTSGSPGKNATGLVEVNGSGTITGIIPMDGGSAYSGSGNEDFTVTGIPVQPGNTTASGQVKAANSNIGDVIRVSGIIDFDGKKFNTDYRISAVSGANEISVVPISPISPGISTLGLGNDVTSTGSVTLIGPSYTVSNFVYNKDVGFATVTTSNNNEFRVNSSVAISGADESLYNGSFVVIDKPSLNQVIIDVGVSTISPSTGGTKRIYSDGILNNFGDAIAENASLNGRPQAIYAGISAQLTNTKVTRGTKNINIKNMPDFGFQIGDYLKVDDEIMRIRETPSRNAQATQLKVFRGVNGTIATTHKAQSVIQKVELYPIEFRRTSIIRASGHTFEYIGYGPGNYSTAFPSKQTKQLSLKEQINVQAQSTSGGEINYTGMNDRGDFYIGNNKVVDSTGNEIVFDTPIQTVTGEDPFTSDKTDGGKDLNYVDSSLVNVERNIVVGGGENSTILSEFNGPVQFTQKVVSISKDGIETNNISIQGSLEVSRNVTVSLNIPTVSGNPGDIVFNANPQNGGTVGWVYTREGAWKTFGTIQT
jgi:hypothetical protein